MPDSPNWVVPFAEAWAEIVKGEPRYAIIGKHLKPLVVKYGADRLYAPWRQYLREHGPYASETRFVAVWGNYEAPRPTNEAPGDSLRGDPGPPIEDGWLAPWFENLTRPR